LDFAVIAVQGPLAPKVLQALGINTDIDYMAFEHVTISNADVILCRTGYTGELGYELLPHIDDAHAVWDTLVETIKPLNGLVCGLGARDTLRTEMGYPLHGHELSLDISPVEASAGWAVGWKKDGFTRSNVLVAQKKR
jgi:aminomethyltransferase